MSIRVVVAAPRVFTQDGAGGGERYVTELVRALENLALADVHLVSGEDPRRLEYRPPGGGRAVPIGVGGFRRLIASADVVHLHQLDSIVGDLALLGATMSRTPLVLTDHGGGWRTPGRLVGHRRLRWVGALAAVSSTSAADLRWPAGRSLHILYGGGDHLPSTAVGQPEYDFVFVGRLVPHKGALELLQSLPDGATCLVLGAPHDRRYAPLVERAAERSGITLQLSASDDDVAGGMRAARWCVCPTQAEIDGRPLRRPELLGLTAIESYVAGTPTLLPDLPAFAELAPLIGGVTYDMRPPGALAASLTACLEHQRQPVASRPKEFFSWRAVAARAIDCYRDLLGSQESGGSAAPHPHARDDVAPTQDRPPDAGGYGRIPVAPRASRPWAGAGGR